MGIASLITRAPECTLPNVRILPGEDYSGKTELRAMARFPDFQAPLDGLDVDAQVQAASTC
jgi:hypothetical protein